MKLSDFKRACDEYKAACHKYHSVGRFERVVEISDKLDVKLGIRGPEYAERDPIFQVRWNWDSYHGFQPTAEELEKMLDLRRKFDAWCRDEYDWPDEVKQDQADQ